MEKKIALLESKYLIIILLNTVTVRDLLFFFQFDRILERPSPRFGRPTVGRWGVPTTALQGISLYFLLKNYRYLHPTLIGRPKQEGF